MPFFEKLVVCSLVIMLLCGMCYQGRVIEKQRQLIQLQAKDSARLVVLEAERRKPKAVEPYGCPIPEQPRGPQEYPAPKGHQRAQGRL